MARNKVDGTLIFRSGERQGIDPVLRVDAHASGIDVLLYWTESEYCLTFKQAITLRDRLTAALEAIEEWDATKLSGASDGDSE